MLRYCSILLFVLFSFNYIIAKELKILQLNIWQETTIVNNGFNGLADDINNINPDIILLCEIRNYNNELFIDKLVNKLKSIGLNYKGVSGLDVGILSKYDIERSETISKGRGIKGIINVENKKVAVYSLHLDYTHYACYLPRGYNGVTWERMNTPITCSKKIEKANKESNRPNEIKEIIRDAYQENDCCIFIGGDFNEPSHLDWREDTKSLWEHNGAVVNWDCSILLYEAGFKDSYREKFPNPKTHPGFTYPANNRDVSVDKLDWVPETDGRDRIDFIYYKPYEGLSLKDIYIVGPKGSIVYNKRIDKEEGSDVLILPKSTWCTDHRGVLGIFDI